MTRSKRTSVADLLRIGALEPVPIDPLVVEHLQSQAANHLRTAQAGLDVGDPEGAFQVAYDACRKFCLALLLANGYRPKEGKGYHVITFQAATALAGSFGAAKVVAEAADLRYVRNSTEYRAEAVDKEDAVDCITLGGELGEAFAGPIRDVMRDPGG